MDEEQSFINAIYAKPSDILPQLIFADWLDERGRSKLATDVRQHTNRQNISSGYGYGDGYGSGYGYGYGYGSGYGYGDGYGSGSGYGYGYGSGDGNGDGDGSGDGDGYGDGSGYGNNKQRRFTQQLNTHEEHDMVKGQNYLFFCNNGWAYIGTYAGPNGLGTHAIKNVSNICRTAGVSWFHLAKGERRDEPVIRVVEGEVTIPSPIAIPWSGDVYKEDQN